jgi:hypothetical protein
MSQYVVLIYDEETWMTDENVSAKLMEGHTKFGENNAAIIKGGAALQSQSTATTLRADASGAYTVTDGPFVETKEVLGGFYLVEAADLDEAIALARQVPVGSAAGALEVRPVMEFD